MCWLIFKGDNNRVVFLSSPQHKSHLFFVKHFFYEKEKLNPQFFFSFPKLFMLLYISSMLDLVGKERMSHVSSRCIGSRGQDLELQKNAIFCRYQRGWKNGRQKYPFPQPHSYKFLLTQVSPWDKEGWKFEREAALPGRLNFNWLSKILNWLNNYLKDTVINRNWVSVVIE